MKAPFCAYAIGSAVAQLCFPSEYICDCNLNCYSIEAVTKAEILPSVQKTACVHTPTRIFFGKHGMPKR